MVALVSFFVILIVSLTIVRVAAVMLELTGISKDTAHFQARSAFTGAGYTTHEAEMIVKHPVRRRIIANLMLFGNIGFVTFVSSLVYSFLNISSQRSAVLTFGILFGGLFFITLIARSKLLNRLLEKIIERFLKRVTKIHTLDYESLLNLAGDFEVITVAVKPDNWLADELLSELKLSEEGVLVLGIRRMDGYFLGSPRGASTIYAGDELIAYGREDALKSLSERRKGPEGDLQHQLGIEQQQRLEGKLPKHPRKKPGTRRPAGEMPQKVAGTIGKIFKKRKK
ncbi:MAG: TrkA C-terminal domain-containing protein [bacterium]